MADFTELISIKRMCDDYQLSRSTVYRLINRGILGIVKIGRSTRIKRLDVERWIESL